MRHLHFLAALCLLMSAATAQTVDEPVPGGTFNTPGYTQGAPKRSANQGQGAETSPADRSSTTQEGTTGRPTAPARSGQAPDPVVRRAEFPPPKPSEFQKFVEAATGRLLPVFGSNFFVDAADALAGLDNVPLSADYVVGPGDELMIRAWGSIDVDYRATVDRNGLVNLPKVGSFNVAGVKASELERHLRAQIGRLFTNFSLNVTLGHLRGVKVFVVGPAQRPGVYTLPSQSTMLSAVVAAGGPAATGSMRKLSLRRDGKVISELDVYEFLVQGDKSKDLQLAAGDVVVFQSVGPRVALTGAIDTPAIYELRGAQEPLGDVLRYAGGTPVLANPNLAQLERIDSTQPKAARFVEEFKLDAAGLQKPLRDGDVLTLLAISPQFANAVTLKGHVAQPLRYAYTPGMRIRDLIPDRDALISPDFYRRKNLLVQVLEPENEMRLVEPDAEAPDTMAERTRGGEQATGRLRETRERRDDRAAIARAKKAPAALFDELNWEYAVVERLNRQTLSTEVIPFNLGKAVMQGDPAQNVELLPGDVVTVYSQKDLRVPVARQTRFVTVEGEVGSPGVYHILPGESLRALLARAGGFTAQAYVYGTEFSREETRKRQRENLQAAMVRLEALAATQAAREVANRREDPGASAVASSSMAVTRARLAGVQPNGRIALELRPEAATLDALPDVPLEHADRIAIPARPGFVTVVGAVVNNNAFLWKPGRTVGDYVKLAGVDEAADESQMFVLRADGTVLHTRSGRGFFSFGGIESQPLYPGDAVVVPNQLDFETWGRALVRNLKDWSQIFSQFGLGAAAIQTLRRN